MLHKAPHESNDMQPSTTPPAISNDLADLALLNIKQVCSLVGMSASSVRAGVRASTFPAPDVVDGMRFTRWKAGTVRRFLEDYTSKPASADVGKALSDRASAAYAKRKPKGTTSTTTAQRVEARNTPRKASAPAVVPKATKRAAGPRPGC